MKINEVSIKNNIDEYSIFEAIELISSSYFNGSEYQPYYAPYAEKIAIIKYFIDGIEFEEGESIYSAYSIDEVKSVVDRFYADPRFSDGAKIMQTIKESVKERVEYKKDRLIHGADALETIASAMNKFELFINDLDSALGTFINLDFSNINQVDIENARDLIKKLNDAGTVLDKETISKVIKDAANYDIDKATADIIDSKNKEIEKLREENNKLKSAETEKNVLVFRKNGDD